MSDLVRQDFDAYFEGVHGHAPFPWQRRLMEQVAMEGRWPRLLDLPTGVGKTAALDIAVFHRALEAERVDRRAPTRIVVVVDRRTIVDQTLERALRIQGKLNKPEGNPAVSEVARRLLAGCAFGEGADVLHVAALRGGMVREDAWARRPDQATILISTVDQVGSRLLFRGYGISDSMRPIHAGLLGNDTLFLLDEVHLSEPFRQTLTALADRYREWSEKPLDTRWQVVEMSATPAGPVKQRFHLDEVDRKDRRLEQRLNASKPIRLAEPVKVTGPEGARVRKFAEALAYAALVDKAPAPGKAVGIVVNRVKTARAVYERLRSLCRDSSSVLLVTGRMRPADREQIQMVIQKRAGAGRPDRVSGAAAIIVVATQCIEAGADLDFDLLITECASWDAIKQRLGRLNRIGEAPECRGIVMIRGDQVDDADDPVYGKALASTWAWLRRQGEEIDARVSGDLMACPCPPECLPELVNAPVILPAHLDSWSQTNPQPTPDPDVALWLHGPRRDDREVQIVWRADLRELDLEKDGRAEENLCKRIALCPPSPGEALSIPIGAARAWLAGHTEEAVDFPDVPFHQEDQEESAPSSVRRALIWRGDDSGILRSADRLRPGDTLIVPAVYGGLTARNWDPGATTSVRDLADRVAMTDRRRPLLRLLPAVLQDDFQNVAFPIPPLRPKDDSDQDDNDVLDAWLGQARALLAHDSADTEWLLKSIEAFENRRTRRIEWVVSRSEVAAPEDNSSAGYYVLLARHRVDATTEDESSSFTGVATTLEDHLRGVADWADAFAKSCGLSGTLARALEAAGRWHDIGKADPRFQRMLHGGDQFKQAIAPALLAKSGLPMDRAARRNAAERSQYPRGARHELMSVALINSDPSGRLFPEGVDRELILHLVASHHGYCRPFAPVIPDTDPQLVEYEGPAGTLRASSDHALASFDSGVSERFFTLTRRYGWFGLAWLEAILRLADHRRSEAEQKGAP